MIGTPGKVTKVSVKTNTFFYFHNDGFISTSNSEQKEQTNREKYVFYCSVSQIHINPEKTHDNDCLNLPIIRLIQSMPMDHVIIE